MIRSSSARPFSYSSRAAGPALGVVEDRRELALELPRREEERPVDERDERLDRHVGELARAQERGRGEVGGIDREREAVRARRVEREQRPLAPPLVDEAQPLLLLAVGGVERALAVGVEQRRHDPDRARRIVHVHDALRIARGDLHRGVLAARGRAADQERQREPAPLHLGRDVRHLVEARRDQAGEPDDVGLARPPRCRGCGRPAPSRRDR